MAQAGKIDHYAVLGVSPEASPEDIKAAYKAAILQHHPDKQSQVRLCTTCTSAMTASSSRAAGLRSIACSLVTPRPSREVPRYPAKPKAVESPSWVVGA